MDYGDDLVTTFLTTRDYPVKTHDPLDYPGRPGDDPSDYQVTTHHEDPLDYQVTTLDDP